MKVAVVLLNLGAPDSLENIEPFLFNLFSDKEIFQIPFGQKFFAKIISTLRAKKVYSQYEAIGGKSPLGEWTEIQRKNLEAELQKISPQIDVYVGMRYWKPLISETAEKLNNNYEKIILLPLYPQYSVTTTGSSINEWNRNYQNKKNKVIIINDYYENDNYLRAINKRIDESLLNFAEDNRDEVKIIFSAHGTPTSFVKKGDPYSEQIKASIKGVMQQRNFSHKHFLCFQSKVGPVEWLKPSTEEMIEKMAQRNNKNLLIVPISFVSDHIETLYELDIEYRKLAEKKGIENYVVMKGLNDSKLFIEALKELVLEKINF